MTLSQSSSKQKRYTIYDCPSFRSSLFKALRNKRGYYLTGNIDSINAFGSPLKVNFEVYFYQEPGFPGHLILKSNGHEQVIKIKALFKYYDFFMLCPLGCNKWRRIFYYFDREDWGCYKCLGLLRHQHIRAKRLARHPKRLFALLNHAKTSRDMIRAIEAYQFFVQYFRQALKTRNRSLEATVLHE